MQSILEQQALEIFYLKYENIVKEIFNELGEVPYDVLIFEAHWANAVSTLATKLELIVGKEKTDEIVLKEMKSIFSFIKENYGTMFIKEYGKNEVPGIK